uniref:12S rRNA N(4)-cytidine methyltransferase METTL15 n=1 Tax=Sarcophilus harrisii TaxID=9305 RepID=G3WTP4_SARHA
MGGWGGGGGVCGHFPSQRVGSDSGPRPRPQRGKAAGGQELLRAHCQEGQDAASFPSRGSAGGPDRWRRAATAPGPPGPGPSAPTPHSPHCRPRSPRPRPTPWTPPPPRRLLTRAHSALQIQTHASLSSGKPHWLPYARRHHACRAKPRAPSLEVEWPEREPVGAAHRPGNGGGWAGPAAAVGGGAATEGLRESRRETSLPIPGRSHGGCRGSRLELFNILDMTFGSGGHSRAILQKEVDVTLYVLDRDPTAYAIAQQLSELYPKQIRALLGQFSQAEAMLIKAGVQPGTVDGVLLDLGCSSMQLDTPERGFSFRKDGPLDMRMDGGRYPDMPTAADVVNALDQQALALILRTYGEEKSAKKIASAIVQARRIYPITRTQQLASIVAGAFPSGALYGRKDLLQRPTHIATKTFQALRIFVNNELNELYAGLQTAQKFLRPGGRLVTLSFHSLEDRLVKRFLLGADVAAKPGPRRRQRERSASALWPSPDREQEPGGSSAPKDWEMVRKKVVTPEDSELLSNPRGRSAKLRAAVRLQGP